MLRCRRAPAFLYSLHWSGGPNIGDGGDNSGAVMGRVGGDVGARLRLPRSTEWPLAQGIALRQRGVGFAVKHGAHGAQLLGSIVNCLLDGLDLKRSSASGWISPVLAAALD